MLERLIEQRDAVTLVLGGVPTVKNLSTQQWSKAADLAATLRPFMDVTQEMCGASYPTLSVIIPIIDGLQNMLQTTRGGLDILRDVLRCLLAEKFGDVFADSTLCVATTVDPRFKLFAFATEARVARGEDATLTHMELVTTTTPVPPETSMTAATSTVDGDHPTSTGLWDKLMGPQPSEAVTLPPHDSRRVSASWSATSTAR